MILLFLIFYALYFYSSFFIPDIFQSQDSSFAAIPEKSWASGDDGHQLPRLFVPVQSNKRMKTFVNAAKQDSQSVKWSIQLIQLWTVFIAAFHGGCGGRCVGPAGHGGDDDGGVNDSYYDYYDILLLMCIMIIEDWLTTDDDWWWRWLWCSLVVVVVVLVMMIVFLGV